MPAIFFIKKTNSAICYILNKNVDFFKLTTFGKHSMLMNQDEPNKNEDKILLQQVAEGSTRAFDQLFEKYWQQAYSSAYKRLKNHDDAKDIVQEVFTNIWIKRQTTQIENLPAYLHVAIRNKVIKFILKQKPVHSFFDFLLSFVDFSLWVEIHPF